MIRANNLFAFAAKSADAETFKTVQQYLEQELTEEEVGQRFKPLSPAASS